jgi:putative DNA-binding protein
MPTLLEIQQAVGRSIIAGSDALAARYILADGLAPNARLGIYRNNFTGTLTGALRLCYPAIHRLVGAEFFEGAARIFISAEPPRRADLDAYGEGFPGFLADFPPAGALPYLPGVARLERAVNRALHAPDMEPLDLSCLSAIAACEHGHVAFRPHPSVALIAADHPVDAIWRAVLAQDDDAMAAIDLDAGPVRLLVERRATGVEVARLAAPAWRFAAALYASRPLQTAIDAVPDVDAAALLAEHLAAGRLIGFELVDGPITSGVRA